MKNNLPKISFGIIVLNGEPFTKYCLRSIYPYAHEIIVVEGATKNAKNISTADGHSLDDTLKSLKEFKEQEDTENKLKIITKKGYWGEKDDMSQAYAKQATGDYLWQVDIDEFYKEEDMQKIIEILKNNSSISSISFLTKSFWGDINYTSDSPIIGNFHRLFKFGPNYKYITHRPPTVVDEKNKNLRNINWISGEELQKKHKINLLHYSLLFPKQVEEKCQYYNQWAGKGFLNWAENNYFKISNPFRVHNTYYSISWLERYASSHPEQIIKMMQDINDGKIKIKLRKTEDIEKLLNSNTYKIKRYIIKKIFYTYKKMRYNIKKILFHLNIKRYD